MIFTDSRYANGRVFRAHDSRSNTYQTTVRRVFPSESADYYTYTWVEGDRVDSVAAKLYGSASEWWRIMDLNPEITDPLNIAPGTVIRVPIG